LARPDDSPETDDSHQNEKVQLIIPKRLAAACGKTPERSDWLARLPDVVGELERRWSLRLGEHLDGGQAPG
jgi:hypothetical protein